MKYIDISFKTPGALDNAINSLEFDNEASMSQEERADKVAEVESFLEEWIRNGENITVRFDFPSKSVTVLHQPTKSPSFRFRVSDK